MNGKKFFIIVMVILVLTGCGNKSNKKVEKIALFASDEIEVNENAVIDIEGEYGKIKWSSSDESIATVEDGIVTGLSNGEVTITAETSSGVKESIDIKVNGAPATLIKLNVEKLTLNPKETSVLFAVSEPSGANVGKIVWESSDSEVVEVSNEGVVTAKKAGVVTISATNENSLSASCEILVVEKEILSEKVTLNNKTISLNVGDATDLNVEISPADTTNKNVVWESSDTSVVIVNEKGHLEAVHEGVAKVTVKTSNNKIDICEVKVNKIDVNKVKLNESNAVIYLGDKITLSASIEPFNASYKYVSWESSDSEVVSVDASGNITANGVGTASIIARASNGVSDTCYVKVLKKEINIIDVEEISLNKSSITLNVGTSERLVVDIKPQDASNKNVIWYSLNEDIARVTSSGRVVGFKEGTTSVIAKTSNGVSASCEVTVKKLELKNVDVSSIEFNKKDISLIVGESETIVKNISPSNAVDKMLVWSSSDNDVVSVNASGKITAKKAGKAVITAKAINGVSASIEVFVKNKAEYVKINEIRLNYKDLSLDLGDSKVLIATISPFNATNKKLKWSSSDSSVIDVDGGKVTAKKVGSAIITVMSEDGISDTCSITVVNNNVSELTISGSKSVVSGSKTKLNVSSNPSDASKSVTWKSSNPKIAVVSTDGVVTGKKNGSVTITAVSNVNSKVSSSIKITVKTAKILFVGNSLTGWNKTKDSVTWKSKKVGYNGYLPSRFVDITSKDGYSFSYSFAYKSGSNLKEIYNNSYKNMANQSVVNQYFDYVVIQPNVYKATSKSWYKDNLYGASLILDKVFKKNKKAKIYVRMVWNGIGSNYEKNRVEHYNNIRKLISELEKKYNIKIVVINDGDALYAANSAKIGKIFYKDNLHGDVNGMNLASYCVASKVLGVDPTKFAYVNSSVGATTAKKLKEYAKRYCYK